MADYAQAFNPGFRLDAARVALVVVDMQYASASREAGLGRLLAERGQAASGVERYDRIETVVVPTIRRLLDFFRARGVRVAYLTVGSERPDYGDVAPHLRAFAEATGNTRGRREHEILDALAPRAGEPVVNKTTMSAFNSTGFEGLLRAWGVEQLVLAGVSTNSCVEGTGRDAADRGFQVLLVEDGCGAATRALHDAACANFARLLGRVASAATVMAELAGPPANTSAAGSGEVSAAGLVTGGTGEAIGPLGLRVGQRARRAMMVTAREVELYAQITGDRNRLHFDADFAARTRFGRLVAQGGVASGMLNALVAMDLPGPGTVFMSQALKYLAPTYLGDTLTAEVEVLSLKPDKPVCQLRAVVVNQEGTRLLEGECWTYTLPAG